MSAVLDLHRPSIGDDPHCLGCVSYPWPCETVAAHREDALVHRARLGRAWSAFLDLALDASLEDGTPLLLALPGDVRDRLRAAVAAGGPPRREGEPPRVPMLERLHADRHETRGDDCAFGAREPLDDGCPTRYHIYRTALGLPRGHEFGEGRPDDGPTVEDVLACPMGENGAGAATVRDYLTALLATLWDEEEGFSGKRPFGDSNWKNEVALALMRGGLLEGEIDEDDGTVVDYDEPALNELVHAAVRAA